MRTKILISIFILTLAQVVYSQGSYLQLSLFDDGMFSVTLDNTSFGAGNYAEFDNVSAGEHSLKVVRMGTENVKDEVIFDNKIKVASGSDLYSVIDEFNSFVIYKKKKYAYNRLVPLGEFVVKCGGSTTTNENNQNVSDECRYKIMKKEDFDDLKGSVGNRNFESSNIAIVKTAIDNNYLSAEQVRTLMNYFTFEDSKLEVAKYSYKKVCDYKNFFKVYDAFDFDSSVTELKNYISGK